MARLQSPIDARPANAERLGDGRGPKALGFPGGWPRPWRIKHQFSAGRQLNLPLYEATTTTRRPGGES